MSDDDEKKLKKSPINKILTESSEEKKIIRNKKRKLNKIQQTSLLNNEIETKNNINNRKRKTIPLITTKKKTDPFENEKIKYKNETLSFNINHISNAVLEIFIQKQLIIDHVFDVAEEILFKHVNGGFDELIYTWIIDNNGVPYNKLFNEEERKLRNLKIKNIANTKRKEHALALEKLSFLENNTDILAEVQEKNDINNLTTNNLINDKDEAWIQNWIKTDQLNTLSQNIESKLGIDQLSYLKSNIVKISIIANWTLKEIGLFELSLCKEGQNFNWISEYIGTKTYKECYVFYTDIFKQSSRYLSFKSFKKYAKWYIN